MSSKVVEIPIYPHLKKFITKFFNVPEGEPVIVRVDNSIGMAMKHVIREKKATYRDLDDFTERMRFKLSSDLARCEIRPGYIISFNKSYNKVFKEKLRQWVKAQWDAGIPNQQAILNFLRYYNIKENEYSYDSAQRYYSRSKNRS